MSIGPIWSNVDTIAIKNEVFVNCNLGKFERLVLYRFVVASKIFVAGFFDKNLSESKNRSH